MKQNAGRNVTKSYIILTFVSLLIEIDSDNRKARKYFEGSVKFQTTLVAILDSLTNRVRSLAAQDIYNANTAQIYGILLLTFVMILSPILIILAKNGITSIQVKILANYKHDAQTPLNMDRIFQTILNFK